MLQQQHQQSSQYSSHSHSQSLGSSASLMSGHGTAGPAGQAGSQSRPPQTNGRQSFRPMSAFQPLDHLSDTSGSQQQQQHPSSHSNPGSVAGPGTVTGGVSTGGYSSHSHRDSDQSSFRSHNVVAVRPAVAPIKFKSQDLRDALALHDAHTRKVYMEGYLSRRDELNPQGKALHPGDDRSRWTLCFLQLCGTVLSVWSVAEMTKAAAEGREVPPSYIDITDAFVDYLGVLVEDVPIPPPQPMRRIQHDNVFTLNSAGQNRIHFCVEGNVGRRLVQAWINAIRLASWEKMRLEEIYTGALLRTRLSAIASQQAAAQGLGPPGPDGTIMGPDGTPLPPLKLITPLVKGKMEGWIKARFMGSTEWQKCYLVLQERRAPHEDESMMANVVAAASGGSSASGSGGSASIDASFGGPGSAGGGDGKKKFWQKLPGSGSNRDSILSFSGSGGGGSGGSGGDSSPPSGSGATFTNDPTAAGPGASDPPPGHNGAMGIASFYETKKAKKPFATLMYVSGVFAVYPSRPELVEGSSLFKVEGSFPGSNVLSATHRARQTGFVLIMPEVEGHSASSPPLGSYSSGGGGSSSTALGANTKMMNWVVAFMDVFRLYGRPRSLIWDPRDPTSFFFAYPIGRFRDRLFLDRELAEFLDVREERHAAQRASLAMVIRKRMQGERTPILPPLPVPNRESTALLERRASRLVSGGVSGASASDSPRTGAGSNGNGSNEYSTPVVGGSTDAGASAGFRSPPAATEDGEADDDDDDKPLGGPLSPRLTVANGSLDTAAVASPPPSAAPVAPLSPANKVTTTANKNGPNTTLTPEDTAQNIAQLRRLSEHDPGLGAEFAALLNFDGGLSASEAAAGGASYSQGQKAIVGPGAGNSAASAYGSAPGALSPSSRGPSSSTTTTPSSTSVWGEQSAVTASSSISASGSGGHAPVVPPKTGLAAGSSQQIGSPSSSSIASSFAPSYSNNSISSRGVDSSSGGGVVRPTAVLATPAGSAPDLAVVPENRPLETQASARKNRSSTASGTFDEGALFYMSSMSDQLPAPAPSSALKPAPAKPIPAPETAVGGAAEVPASAAVPQRAASIAHSSVAEEGAIDDDALAAYSYLEKPPSPAIGAGSLARTPTAASVDLIRTASNTDSFASGSSSIPSDPVAATRPNPPPINTTFSKANKRAMERKTAAQLQAQAHQEAMMKPGQQASVSTGQKSKKKVDMGKAKKRGKGAWGGDTSSDDDEDEEEEDDNEEEDQDERDVPLTARPGRLGSASSAALHAQHQAQAGSARPGATPQNGRQGSAGNVHSMEALQRAAANAGLEAPAPGRFSSYDGGFSSGGSGRGRDPSPVGMGTGTPTAGGSGSGGWGSGRSSPMRSASPGAGYFGGTPGGGSGSGPSSTRQSPRVGPVHVGPGSAAMMLQAATANQTGSIGASRTARGSVFNSHLGAQHEGSAAYQQDPAALAAYHAQAQAQAQGGQGQNLGSPQANTFVQLNPEEQPGAMTTIFQPHGLLQAGAQDKLERSAKAREDEARAAGGHLVSVPHKPPPPQAGLLGAITAHERDRKGAGGIGATLTERERDRVATERRTREEEAMYRNSFHPQMGMSGMGMMPPMGIYPNPYMWQQMMMQQQQMMMAQQMGGGGMPGGPPGWGGSQMGGGGGSPGTAFGGGGGPGGSNSPRGSGTPSTGASGGGHAQMGSSASVGGGGFDAMAAQQAAMQAAQQAYMQAMSQMGGGSVSGAEAGNRMSMAMSMPGMGYMAPPMSMMGFPAYPGGEYFGEPLRCSGSRMAV
ncbi:hypothetical protein V8E36_007623 [Tilletia maclaganii]